MSRDQGKDPSSGREDWVQEQLSALRAALAAGRWPATADRLLADLAASEAEADGEDIDMLSLAINDALDGVDISARYPRFYRRLLADMDLRDAFLDALAILAPEDASGWDTFPPEPSLDMPFLEEEIHHPLVENVKDGWRILWQRSIPQLEKLFGLPPSSPTGPPVLAEAGPVWRGVSGSAPGALDEETLPLLRDRVQVGDVEVEVFLEVTLQPGDAGKLDPTLIVTAPASLEDLQVTVRWGTYRETAPVSPGGAAPLPALPLTAIFDEKGITSLELELNIA